MANSLTFIIRTIAQLLAGNVYAAVIFILLSLWLGQEKSRFSAPESDEGEKEEKEAEPEYSSNKIKPGSGVMSPPSSPDVGDNWKTEEEKQQEKVCVLQTHQH